MCWQVIVSCLILSFGLCWGKALRLVPRFSVFRPTASGRLLTLSVRQQPTQSGPICLPLKSLSHPKRVRPSWQKYLRRRARPYRPKHEHHPEFTPQQRRQPYTELLRQAVYLVDRTLPVMLLPLLRFAHILVGPASLNATKLDQRAASWIRTAKIAKGL